MIDDVPLAWQWFRIEDQRGRVEDKLTRALDEAGIRYDDWHTDGYDGSIELYCCDPLTDEQQAVLWKLGFDRAWTHPGEDKVKALERYYVAPSR